MRLVLKMLMRCIERGNKMSENNIVFPCIKVEQPLGEFFIASIPYDVLCEITWVDVRRIEGERGFETYLGIQRPLKKNRVKDLSEYVNTPDSCFPTAVILAIPPQCVSYDQKESIMRLFEGEDDEGNIIDIRKIAKVIDGQHRIEGLRRFKGNIFEINVSIFVDMDIADQAYLFSTVNLAQTKVNKSLVYDLFALAKNRSPQKTCHNIAVALDDTTGSPFYERIKRLGVSTEGRFNETVTQATVVQAIMKYISDNPQRDRSDYLRRSKPKIVSGKDNDRFIFRNMFIDEKDNEITDIIWNFFEAVKQRWPKAWDYSGRGLMLNKTNGFKALMRFLKPVYLHYTKPGGVPKKDEFFEMFERIDMGDKEFNVETFKPGSSGESALYKTLMEKSEIVEFNTSQERLFDE